jgi:tetratricopeptide (TPR) repeat protein
MMKKVLVIGILISGWLSLDAQVVYNPNVAIKPLASLSVYKVETNDSTTTVVIRIVNDRQLTPFTIKNKNLFIRQVSDPDNRKLLRYDKAPFAPEKHTFSFQGEVFEFTLVFEALPKNTKYFDLMEDGSKREFYVQGIILDPSLNKMVTRGFQAFAKGDRAEALAAFIEMANADLYFEYGLAYFNIIYLLDQENRIAEAQEWYDKFKERFFYDKQLYENEFVRLGIRKKLK